MRQGIIKNKQLFIFLFGGFIMAVTNVSGATKNAPYHIEANKGSVVVQQALGNNETAYQILEPDNASLIQVQQTASSLKFFVPEAVEKFRVQIMVSEDSLLHIHLDHGSLVMQRVINSLQANVINGIISYFTSDNTKTVLDAKVEVGNISYPESCDEDKLASIGYTGKQLQAVCGSGSKSNKVNLQVTHGSIQVQ